MYDLLLQDLEVQALPSPRSRQLSSATQSAPEKCTNYETEFVGKTKIAEHEIRCCCSLWMGLGLFDMHVEIFTDRRGASDKRWGEGGESCFPPLSLDQAIEVQVEGWLDQNFEVQVEVQVEGWLRPKLGQGRREAGRRRVVGQSAARTRPWMASGSNARSTTSRHRPCNECRRTN